MNDEIVLRDESYSLTCELAITECSNKGLDEDVDEDVGVLEAGLRAGKFVSGRLSVNKHLAMTEAFVSRGSSHEKTGASSDTDILISGVTRLMGPLHNSDARDIQVYTKCF